jgi:Flp pilus assembly protein TadG
MRTAFLFPRVALSFLRFRQKIESFEVGQEYGGALIETALAVPLLALLLLGASELGMADYQAIEVTNAAKAGAQYGAQSVITAADISGIQTAAQNEASNLTQITTTKSTTTICSDGNPTTGTPPGCPSGAVVETILTVQTQSTFDAVIIIPGLTPSFTLHGQAVQKVAQ